MSRTFRTNKYGEVKRDTFNRSYKGCTCDLCNSGKIFKRKQLLLNSKKEINDCLNNK
jgi:hypothetical protein